MLTGFWSPIRLNEKISKVGQRSKTRSNFRKITFLALTLLLFKVSVWNLICRFSIKFSIWSVVSDLLYLFVWPVENAVEISKNPIFVSGAFTMKASDAKFYTWNLLMILYKSLVDTFSLSLIVCPLGGKNRFWRNFENSNFDPYALPFESIESKP